MPNGTDIQGTEAIERIMLDWMNWGGKNTTQTTADALKAHFINQGMSPEMAIQWAMDTMRTWQKRGAGETFWSRVGFPEEMPAAAWQRQMGLPATGRNPFQEWLAGQVTPAFAGWGAQEAARAQGIQPGEGAARSLTSWIERLLRGGAQSQYIPFSSFIPGIAGQFGGGQMGQQAAAETLKQLRGRGGPTQQNWLSSIEAKGGPGLGNVLLAGLQGRGQPAFVARSMAGRLPALRTGWEAETFGGAEPGDTFLDYLLRNVGF